MTVRIAISGMGRIGRLCLRAVFELARADIEVVAINNRGKIDAFVHLFKYDSVHGRFGGEVSHDDKSISINGKRIPILQASDPAELDWKPYNVDVLFECTGKFTDREGAMKHIKAGAKKVLVSAPAKDDDATIVFGVNNAALKPEHTIVSCGSCTTNCLAPVVHVLNNLCGIENGFMTTIHAYTGDQNLHDGSHKDLHRARAAGMSMVPTTTGAAAAIGKVIPALKGKLDGVSIRVPTANVSLVDLKFNAVRAVTADEIKAAMKTAAAGDLKGILAVYDEPLVSIDFNHSPYSANFALNEVKVMDKLVRVMAWYDNEWAFAIRMLDVATLMK
jgi:glyceraldehyde 3-phosphate dehydrogenase